MALFSRLFRGRADVYAVRWEGKTPGKAGYSPACANEWRPGVCEKPRIKCSECTHRELLPLTDKVVHRHLTGKHIIGVYPMGADDTCHFLAVDFDDAEWRDDARAFAQSCNELGVPVVLEISRSGQGAHAWVFFAGKVPAREARRLGAALISHTCSRTRQLTLASYDRLFPNQDTVPKGGFGNLIALPFQNEPREQGRSVFVDAEWQPHVDQWAFLAAIRPMPPHDIEPTIPRASGGGHPLRGCLDAALDLLRENGIRGDLIDERCTGEPLSVGFAGTLRPDQEAAVTAMQRHDAGVLCAPTAFGKTVVAAALIARRGVSTLVLVHRKELLRQWQERLHAFLSTGTGSSAKDLVGVVGGGKARPTGKIDIAVMQSVSRQGEVDPLVECYGHVIVDECHHVGAVSFEAILKRTQAKYVLGLTATPIRRDGQQPILFMQCGAIRHTAARPVGVPHDLEVVARTRSARIDLAPDAGIQEVFRHLAQDPARTQAIAEEVLDLHGQGRKVLVLTERMEHLEALQLALGTTIPTLFVLHGRMSGKQRATLIAGLDALPPEAPRVLLATGKLVGEGFDHPPLDTLVLAMPISWKGTLQQYAGRLHREQAGKTDVRIIDFVDTGHPALLRMWGKRQRGYRAMGYGMACTTRSNCDGELL